MVSCSLVLRIFSHNVNKKGNPKSTPDRWKPPQSIRGKRVFPWSLRGHSSCAHTNADGVPRVSFFHSEGHVFGEEVPRGRLPDYINPTLFSMQLQSPLHDARLPTRWAQPHQKRLPLSRAQSELQWGQHSKVASAQTVSSGTSRAAHHRGWSCPGHSAWVCYGSHPWGWSVMSQAWFTGWWFTHRWDPRR